MMHPDVRCPQTRQLRRGLLVPTLLLSALAAAAAAALLLPFVPGPKLAKVAAAAVTTAVAVAAGLLLRERLGPSDGAPEPAP